MIKWTEENIKNIIELREQGKTYKEIAEKFKCSPGVITNILKKQGKFISTKRIYAPKEEINQMLILERDFNPPWKSNETAYKVQCLKCKNIWTIRKSELERGEHDCFHKKGGRGHCKMSKGDLFGLLTITGNRKTIKSKSDNYNVYYEVQCKCGSKPFYVRSSHLTRSEGATISCGCANKSAGEIKISSILKQLNIEFQEQYKIPELSHYMRFDFALFKNKNLYALIEYDGRQHFEPVAIWGGESQFKEQQERDKRKDEYCKAKEIPLIRIPYTDFKILDEEYLLSRIPKI